MHSAALAALHKLVFKIDKTLSTKGCASGNGVEPSGDAGRLLSEIIAATAELRTCLSLTSASMQFNFAELTSKLENYMLAEGDAHTGED